MKPLAILANTYVTSNPRVKLYFKFRTDGWIPASNVGASIDRVSLRLEFPPTFPTLSGKQLEWKAIRGFKSSENAEVIVRSSHIVSLIGFDGFPATEIAFSLGYVSNPATVGQTAAFSVHVVMGEVYDLDELEKNGMILGQISALHGPSMSIESCDYNLGHSYSQLPSFEHGGALTMSMSVLLRDSSETTMLVEMKNEVSASATISLSWDGARRHLVYSVGDLSTECSDFEFKFKGRYECTSTLDVHEVVDLQACMRQCQRRSNCSAFMWLPDDVKFIQYNTLQN